MSNNNINDSIDIRNNHKIVESYNSRNNFFYIEQSAVAIQRAFRSFVFRNKETIVLIDSSRRYSEFSANSVTNRSKSSGIPIRGLFLLKNKKFHYKGHFTKNKTKQGFGIVEWEDNSRLYSMFNSNKTSGISKFLNCSGQTFKGEYVNNRPLGYGIYNERGEVSYEGYWVNSSLDGFAVEEWKDGTSYKGEMRSCKKEGIGVYSWPDGTVYQGEWKDDKMEGNGILRYSDSRMYEGEIKDGYMNGYGLFSWPDGKRFFGQYNKDVKEGFGIFLWSLRPLQAFVGFWSQGKQNGIGIKINEANVKYGIWKKGVKELWLQGPWELRKYCPKEKRSFLSLIENEYQNILTIIQ